MSFEEFEVVLLPRDGSPFRSGNDTDALHRVVNEITAHWPAFHRDDIEISRLFPPPSVTTLEKNRYLVSETEQGLIQLTGQLGLRDQQDIAIWLRFAYVNPRSVYEPFCDLIEWLMARYQLSCCATPFPAPEQEGVSGEICDPKQVRARLIPSMDYNRRLWQLDVGTDEEAILRPGDAVARFIMPHTVPGPAMFGTTK